MTYIYIELNDMPRSKTIVGPKDIVWSAIRFIVSYHGAAA